MILTYQKRITIFNRILIGILLSVLLFVPVSLYAQERTGLSLSVTPTLFEMSAVPLQSWSSSVKVINNNPQPITVYANAVNFAPQGETGEGKFIPILEEGQDGTTLVEWIDITSEPVTIEAEQSMAIPFTVAVPQDATPGGHFAAILIGTRPLDTDERFQVKTAQIVTSLFFVRVAGDVVEDGKIREFRTTEAFVDTPQANFEVRFENEGNVHLQPQGEIVITNMWGKERGLIPINHKTHFGNVLPDSIRKFEFSWSGEPSFNDIGRYKAVLTLAYGDEERKFVTRSLYFYVIPFKALAVVLGSLIAFILFVSWGIKAYVRRMLMLAGVEPESSRSTAMQRSFQKEGDVRIVRRTSIQAPVRSGMLDLKQRLQGVTAFADRIKTLVSFVAAYRVFFVSVVVIVLAAVAGIVFFVDVTQEQRDYEVVIENADTNVTLSSEEILYDKVEKEPELATSSAMLEEVEVQSYELVLVNSSDTPGAAASLQSELEKKGYSIADLQSDFEESKDRTVIVYDLAFQTEALSLSKLLGNALLSARPENEGEESADIVIYIGNDLSGQ